MGNPLQAGVPDLNAVGWAEYGHRRGVHRILDVLARQDVRATINVSGIMAERYPQIVRRMADDGHDVVAHSYTMDVVPVYLSEEKERANIRRNTELIERATGRCPRGWISPRSTPSLRTPQLLAEAGYDWHGDTLNDDLPYLVRYADRSIVAFPSARARRERRSAVLPDVPAVAETPKGFDATSWYGIFAPAGTPKAVVAKLLRRRSRRSPARRRHRDSDRHRTAKLFHPGSRIFYDLRPFLHFGCDQLGEFLIVAGPHFDA